MASFIVYYYLLLSVIEFVVTIVVLAPALVIAVSLCRTLHPVLCCQVVAQPRAQ